MNSPGQTYFSDVDLFDHHRETMQRKNAPLADRMRPRTLDEFCGQDHIIGPGRLLRRAIQVDQLSSLIFFGPPGTGKTTLARIIANTTKAQFISINAVLAGVKDIREAIDSAQTTLSLYGRRTILFVDEVHRFNKAQQDALLPHVENGILILIGATTENPYFEVNKALVSRSRIFQLRKLDDGALRKAALLALADPERGYGSRTVRIDNDALDHLVSTANGDARGVLNALELAVETTPPDDAGVIRITRAIAEESIQQKAVLYDKDGDAHYDIISAFIKSVRGSDPDGALYWMAKMVYAGEDPRFIFRRMLILACEDVGLADPHALSVVVSASQAFDYVGLPEGRYHLAHACLYLATAPKSNSSMAFFDAIDAVSKESDDEVPNHLRDASRDKDGFGHGKGYLYPHAYRDHWAAQQYLPDVLQGRVFFQPSDQGYEKEVQQRVMRLREAMVEAMVSADSADPLSGVDATTLPGQEQWARRSLTDNVLAEVRDRVLDLAGIGPESLVLDLSGQTGLLCCEAARRIREGSVWVLTTDARSHAALTTMTAQFDTLSRPQIVSTSWESFDADLRAAAGAAVVFTSVIGRNALGRQTDKPGLLERVLGLLSREGVIALAESVPSQAQRLSETVTFTSHDAALRQALAEAETALFADANDPLVNWTPESLAEEIRVRLDVHVTVSTVEYQLNRRFSRQEIERWFRVAAVGERKSLGDRLRERIDGADVDRVKAVINAHLGNRSVEWKTVTAFFRIARREESGREETGQD